MEALLGSVTNGSLDYITICSACLSRVPFLLAGIGCLTHAGRGIGNVEGLGGLADGIEIRNFASASSSVVDCLTLVLKSCVGTLCLCVTLVFVC